MQRERKGSWESEVGPGGARLVMWALKERDWIPRSRDVAADLSVVHLRCNGEDRSGWRARRTRLRV